MVEAAMRDSGVTYSELDLIAATRGPGGFTGVRIGLATARGLALASGKPLFAVSNFEVVAAATSAEERAGRVLAVLLDAKREDFYLQCFDSELKALDEPRACRPEDLARARPPPRSPRSGLLLAGDAVEQGLPSLESHGAVAIAAEARHADARVLARLAASAGEGAFGERRAEGAQPLYLRAPDVTQPRPRR
jgi:tRNA threonylcarbamoyladenosine biosynthesis protein TsaB